MGSTPTLGTIPRPGQKGRDHPGVVVVILAQRLARCALLGYTAAVRGMDEWLKVVVG